MVWTIRDLLLRLESLDLALCSLLNQWLAVPWVAGFAKIISRMGDGVLWYALMTVFPLVLGWQGLVITIWMAITSVWGLYCYSQIKRRVMRPRPFVLNASLRQGARALDEFSFPSGHTMHATAFALVLSNLIPLLGWLLIPFALLTGLARVVLALHFPSDVMGGMLLGLLNGALVLLIGGYFS